MSNSVIRLRSGVYFDILDPDPDTIILADIAGSLSKICRFGGHGYKFYSVAEHCVNCEAQAQLDSFSPEERLAVLFHDATEAYLGDVVRPLKLQLTRYHEIEAIVESAIAARFQIDFKACHSRIKQIDNDLLIAERNALFPPEPEDGYVWAEERDNTRRSIRINPQFWTPCNAEYYFLSVAVRLIPDHLLSVQDHLAHGFRTPPYANSRLPDAKFQPAPIPFYPKGSPGW